MVVRGGSGGGGSQWGCSSFSATRVYVPPKVVRVNPKFVQELLGHGDVSLTLNVYSHVLPRMGDQTATAMDNALG